MAQSDFATRLLAERTRALAARGLATEQDASLPARLVCVAGGRHYGLAIGAVASAVTVACHPMPLVGASAAHAMLGVAQIGGQLFSVLDLAGMLSGPAEPRRSKEGGVMLTLRGCVPPVAVRVDRVLGALRLLPSEEPGHALLQEPGPQESGSSGIAPLVMLVDEAMLHAAIAALDAVAGPAAGPAGILQKQTVAGV